MSRNVSNKHRYHSEWRLRLRGEFRRLKDFSDRYSDQHSGYYHLYIASV